MKRRVSFAVASLLAVSIVLLAGTAAGQTADVMDQAKKTPAVSGVVEFDASFGTGLVECPQAGEPVDKQPRPLDLSARDRVEQISNGGDDIRVNQDYSCLSQNETSIAVSKRLQRNLVAGVNDYATAGQKIYASTDSGMHWYEQIFPPIDVPARNNLEASDPAVAFDRAGLAYYAVIAFDRTEDTNGVFVSRSSNGGFTWSKPCTATDLTPSNPADDSFGCGPAARGAAFDPRKPGDGVVSFADDPDRQLNGNQPFNDKEYIAVGPRPAGVEPVCFSHTHTPAACQEGTIGIDRIYVTWTKFTDIDAAIFISWSDDQGRSWSPERAISGSAPFCVFGVANNCDVDQFSVPTVHPTTGLLGVAFENFNTPDENQYLFVRSRDGGSTFEGPFFVTPVFDVNYPRAGAAGGRPDCTARSQQSGRPVLTNSCFRVNSGGNVVVDRRGGAFADDFYLVMSDNRNGTRASSNTDVFFFKSTDGGTTWIGPSRVNDDRSDLGGVSRTCSPSQAGCLGNFGNDQWFPWIDIGDTGDMSAVFYDRRLDQDSTASEWPGSRQRPGNYLSWFFGGECSITRTATVTQATTTIPAGAAQCLAPGATVIPQPTAPVNPGADPQPGQGAAFLGLFENFTISDTPSNFDYAFQGGTFIGDYNNVAIGQDNQAWGFWTDARNGRSSRLGGTSAQPGRNPICEQSDVFADKWSAQSGGSVGRPKASDELYLVTPCPTESIEPGNR